MRSWLLLLTFGACGGGLPPLPAACEMPIQGTSVTFRLIAKTQGPAILVTSPPHDLRRFVIEQSGRILMLTDTGVAPTPFLDLSADAGGPVQCCGEQGLLGLAFHPNFATNHTFYVFYTTATTNVLARYKVSATNPDVADPASGEVMISIADFASNHNGGMLEFGKDGYLYIGTGDGGGGGDPMHNGQNPMALLGKLLRIDVDKPVNGKLYGIPAKNPFADGTAGAPEVYDMGLRNPWRWSVDRMTGDLWIGDVGQDTIEEMDVIPAGTPPGLNFGWNMYEGESCFSSPCDPAGKTMPSFTKTHDEGWCSMIAGQVYRGGCYPDIAGQHFFTDYCKHELWTGVRSGGSTTFQPVANVHYIDESGTHDGAPPTPSSLHDDARGELYMTTTDLPSTQINGGVWQLEAGP